ncbi:MAG: MurR/RpiR family transcriptional regulator [Clostridia bacterium]|nr:MurR/RpiR family transcriptional regulator [Clostridia bacterium]
MTNQLLAKIEKRYSSLSKGHKKIADYITKNYDKAAFMTAAKLGNKVGVSESTVVRFATELGYDGYPELQKNLQEVVKNRLTSVQRMEVAGANVSGGDILERSFASDIETIKATREQTSREAFNASVEAINKARHIYVLGVRSSASLASFAAFYLNFVYDHVTLIEPTGTGESFEQAFRINSEDVCIAISFPRYSKQTINMLQFISDRGATVISITDSENSPIANFATHLLLARSNMVSFVDSLVAPLSLINALIAAAAKGRSEEVYNNLNILENIWDEYQIYQTHEDE